jgi:hypothetical protein
MLDFQSKAPAQAIVSFVKAPKASIGGIVKIPKQADETYDEIICTPIDIATVQEVVTILGETLTPMLFFKKGYLRNVLEPRISNLHPLKFMTSIFCYPHLGGHMRVIFDDFIKRDGFMNGLGPGLDREAKKGKLAKHLPKFAEEIGVPLENMQPYFDSQRWEALCEFIIEYKK